MGYNRMDETEKNMWYKKLKNRKLIKVDPLRVDHSKTPTPPSAAAARPTARAEPSLLQRAFESHERRVAAAARIIIHNNSEKSMNLNQIRAWLPVYKRKKSEAENAIRRKAESLMPWLIENGVKGRDVTVYFNGLLLYKEVVGPLKESEKQFVEVYKREMLPLRTELDRVER